MCVACMQSKQFKHYRRGEEECALLNETKQINVRDCADREEKHTEGKQK